MGTKSTAKPTLIVIAWLVMLVVSDLPDILITWLGGPVPSWIFWAKAGFLAAFLVLTLLLARGVAAEPPTVEHQPGPCTVPGQPSVNGTSIMPLSKLETTAWGRLSWAVSLDAGQGAEGFGPAVPLHVPEQGSLRFNAVAGRFSRQKKAHVILNEEDVARLF